MTKLMQTEDVVEFKEPNVATLSINVNVLQVGKKQMTLSVFRQLQKADLLNEDGGLAGVAWGRVNYHWGECDGVHDEHLHVVWQNGSQLFRDTVLHNGCKDEVRRLLGECDDIAFVGAMREALAEKPVELTAHLLRTKTWRIAIQQHVQLHLDSLWTPPPKPPLEQQWGGTSQWLRERITKEIEERAFLFDRNELDVVTAPQEQLVALFQARKAESEKVAADWQRHWTELQALPQLFIAV